MKTIFDLVKEDLDVRNRIGYEQWKKELYPDDGKDWLQNAYEEALDLCVYLKGELAKRAASQGAGSLPANGQGTRHARTI